jgi:hypothetical protein
MANDGGSRPFIKVSGKGGSAYVVTIPEDVLSHLDPDLLKTLQELDENALEGLDGASVERLAESYSQLAKTISDVAAERNQS